MHERETITFTIDDVKAALSEVIADNPADHKNPGYATGEGCYYTAPDGSPSCLVGNVLHYLGIQRPTPTDDINESGWPLVRTYAPYLNAFTEDANELLEVVQANADQGKTWPLAVQLAE